MTRRLTAALAVTMAALATAAPSEAAAAPAWTSPQDLGEAGGDFLSDSALASNDRGDAVVVVARTTGVFAARARAHEGFAALRRIARSGSRPSVAIDPRGIAVIAFDYFDGTHEATDLRDDDCCTGVKVGVWRPGHAPTRPRAVRRRGISTQLGAIAATRGHRGVLVAGDPYSATTNDTPQLAPMRLDGRIGALRAVAKAGWIPTTLQWVGGRAVAGLARSGDGHGTQIAVARQRRDRRFNAPRVFVRLTGQLATSYLNSKLAALQMTPDGHGGQIAVYQRGKRPHLRIALSRKPLEGRARTSIVQRGPARGVKLTPPARARDGSIAFAWARGGGSPGYRETPYVTTRSRLGRLRTARLLDGVSSVEELAVAAAPGGAGAVGVRGTIGLTSDPARILALGEGVPLPAVGLQIAITQFATTSIVLSANARDPARAVYEVGGRAFATLLRAGSR
jgi:hypothetical protein